MTRTLLLTAAALMSLGAPAAFAQSAPPSGDAAAGEGQWRGCRSCHSITDEAGTMIQRGGRTGPNLYALPGRAVASEDGFRYSPSLLEYAETEGGQVWTEAVFVEYVADPTAFLRHHLDSSSARSTMSFRMASGAEDLWAYLVSVSPEETE